MRKVYLDVCCLSRPFDDQRQGRVHLEAEAVLLILKRCESGEWHWVSSAVVSYEVDRIPNQERRHRVTEILRGAKEIVPLTDSAVERGEELKKLGLKTYDALHVACAEHAQADIFLTTDDRLVRAAARNARKVKIPVKNPLTWLQEVL
ncbi:MAG: PIN domain-containing protein [Deltaproteobacteria bacterium]|nr:PIN domain-containing protein [Deltaproteobacteria bacterium]